MASRVLVRNVRSNPVYLLPTFPETPSCKVIIQHQCIDIDADKTQNISIPRALKLSFRTPPTSLLHPGLLDARQPLIGPPLLRTVSSRELYMESCSTEALGTGFVHSVQFSGDSAGCRPRALVTAACIFHRMAVPPSVRPSHVREHLGARYGSNVCAPPKPHVEVRPPHMMALGGRAFTGDHTRTEPSRMGLVPLLKRPQRTLSLSTP